METIQAILNRPTVQSVTFSKNLVVIRANNIDHRYSMEHFINVILPKLMEQPK